MIIFLSLILSLILVLMYVVDSKKNKDIFSPVKLSTLFLFVYNVPFIINYYFDKNIIDSRIDAKVEDLDSTMIIYILYMIFGVFALYLGINFSRKRKMKKINKNRGFHFFNLESEARYLTATILVFSLGLIFYIDFIQSVGGFTFWLNNIANRAAFTTGNGYSTLFISLLPISVYFYIGTFNFKNNMLKKIILISLVLFTFIILTTLGGRKSSLEFVIFCIIIWNYKIGKIKNLKKKILLLSPLAIFYMIAIPILRTSQDIMGYITDIGGFSKEVLSNLTSIITEVSYVGHYLFIINYFDNHEFWLGKTFKDLFFVVIPRSFYPDKPPVDDGVYVKSLVEGMNIAPNAPYTTLYKSSLPPETFGNMYLNFGFIGVLIGMFLLGLIFRQSYEYMIKNEYNLFSILIYANIIISFQLSNLRITQFFSDLLLYMILFSVFFTFKIYKNNNLSQKRY